MAFHLKRGAQKVIAVAVRVFVRIDRHCSNPTYPTVHTRSIAQELNAEVSKDRLALPQERWKLEHPDPGPRETHRSLFTPRARGNVGEEVEAAPLFGWETKRKPWPFLVTAILRNTQLEVFPTIMV